jgi:hypothetical protein
MPTVCGWKSAGSERFPMRRMKTVWLVTVLGSMAPSKGIEIRGSVLKPSSWLSSATSRQSDGCVAQFGDGRFTRRFVL